MAVIGTMIAGASSFLAMGFSGLLAEWIGLQAVFGLAGVIAIGVGLTLIVLKRRLS